MSRHFAVIDGSIRHFRKNSELGETGIGESKKKNASVVNEKASTVPWTRITAGTRIRPSPAYILPSYQMPWCLRQPVRNDLEKGKTDLDLSPSAIHSLFSDIKKSTGLPIGPQLHVRHLAKQFTVPGKIQP